MEEQKQDFSELIDQILHESTGYGKFKVFDYEASSGKTWTYAKAVVDYYHTPDDNWSVEQSKELCNKSLIVIKTMAEGNNVANLINKFEETRESKDKPYSKFAIAINTEYKLEHPELKNMDEDGYIKYLHSIPVLIITQKEYLNTCSNPQRGQKYYGNRNLLIVDEEIDIVYNSFTVLMMSDISLIEDKYLSGCREAQEIFRKIVEEIKPYLVNSTLQMKRILIQEDLRKINNLVIKLHYELNTSINEKKLEQLKKYLDFQNITTVEEARMIIIDKIRQIEKFYNNTSVVKYGVYLHTYNKEQKLFTLKNNIWIDASAGFNVIYKIAEDTYEMASKSERLIDHSDCKLIFDMVTKSTTTGKSKYKDLEYDVLKFITNSIQEGDKVLIIDNKEECDRISKMLSREEFGILAKMKEEKAFDTVNFQAMRGSNIWGSYNKIYIIQQPQFLLVYYVFVYEYWAKCRLADVEMYLGNHIDKKSEESVFGFYLPEFKDEMKVSYTDDEKKHSEELEMVRYTTQASSIYQGIKRIQRNSHPVGEMTVMLGDKRMRELVASQLKNVRVEYINMKITPKQESPESDVIKLTNMIYEMPIGYIANIDKIADKLQTGRDYIKTIIKRNPSLQEVINNRWILIVSLSKVGWYLLSVKNETEISIAELENHFSIKWDNFRRSKDFGILNSKRRIKFKSGKLFIGKCKY